VNGIEIDESGTVKNADEFFEPIGKNYADSQPKRKKAAHWREHLQHQQHKSPKRLRALWLKKWEY